MLVAITFLCFMIDKKLSQRRKPFTFFFFFCNHTFPVYFISTTLTPAENPDTHTDIENKDFRP